MPKLAYTLLAVIVVVLSIFSTLNTLRADWVDPEWVHPKASTLKLTCPGPFVKLDDDSLLRVSDGHALVSKDDGRTWGKLAKLYDGPKPGTPRSGLLVRANDGTIVMAYHDKDTYKRAWDKKTRQYSDDSRQDIWTIRSLDGGKTWVDRQRIFSGYGAIFINIMQSDNGNIVLPLQGLMVGRNHHCMCTYTSPDVGKTWQKSNVIDLGGQGNHEGAYEGTVAQLSDGRLWMLIRTNLDQFWSAYSSDNGRYWRVIQPSGIDASSAPGFLLRLQSGCLVLVWNRLYPEGKTSYPRKKGDGNQTTEPASWHRGELSLALSENDGKTWTKPAVIARTKSPRGMAYPDVFERRPGELWITTRHPTKPRVRISLKEADFVGK